MKFEFFTTAPKQTKKAGKILAEELLKTKPQNQAFLLALVGDLAGGKTTFLQGFAKGLGMKDKILSPTFIIMRRIENFFHIDCYRIQNPQEILNLGFKEIITNPQNIVAIEWADKIRRIIPKEAIWLDFKFIDNKTREIVVKSDYARQKAPYRY